MARTITTLSLMASLAACAPALVATDTADNAISDARAAELENFVIQDCGSCHGLTLKGGLGTPLTKQRLHELAPEDLFYIIDQGIPGTPMPGWGALLSPEEINWIIDFLKRVAPNE